MRRKFTHEEFVNRAIGVHGNKYRYDEYYSMHTKLHVTCPDHGKFEQEPGEHLKGYGCPRCAVERRTKSQEQFEHDARQVHGDTYHYGVYRGTSRKMSIQCRVHGWFRQTPNKHLRGHGCPQCARKNYSLLAITWLSHFDDNIQHAKNGGEYRIPELGLHVDGFCRETKTVYEFHGDKFHGNPTIYGPAERCHPFNDTPAAELYQRTVERDNAIRDAGYELITIWESEFLGEE